MREEEDGGFDWTLTVGDDVDFLTAASSCGIVVSPSSMELLAKASVAFLKW